MKTSDTIELPASTLTKSQFKKYGPKRYSENGQQYNITATVRYDDQCGNGHNSFAITADIRENGRDYMGGCCHDEVAKHFPELVPFIKWHLVDSSQPMHYLANTLYWLGYSGWCDGKAGDPPNIEHARSTAVWPDMPESFIAPKLGHESDIRNMDAQNAVREALESRKATLLADFRKAVESLGFVY